MQGTAVRFHPERLEHSPSLATEGARARRGQSHHHTQLHPWGRRYNRMADTDPRRAVFDVPRNKEKFALHDDAWRPCSEGRTMKRLPTTSLHLMTCAAMVVACGGTPPVRGTSGGSGGAWANPYFRADRRRWRWRGRGRRQQPPACDRGRVGKRRWSRKRFQHLCGDCVGSYPRAVGYLSDVGLIGLDDRQDRRRCNGADQVERHHQCLDVVLRGPCVGGSRGGDTALSPSPAGRALGLLFQRRVPWGDGALSPKHLLPSTGDHPLHRRRRLRG